MVSVRLSLWAVAGAALLAVAFALAASAATAGASAPMHSRTYGSARVVTPGTGQRIFVPDVGVIPDTGKACNPNPLDTVTECTKVVGTGLKITSLTGYFVAYGPLSNVHIELYGPHGLIKNCPTFNTNGGTSPYCIWTNPHPTVNQTGGNYCSEGWQLIAPGDYGSLGVECIDVHS